MEFGGHQRGVLTTPAGGILCGNADHVQEFRIGKRRDNEIKCAAFDRLDVKPYVREWRHHDNIYRQGSFRGQSQDIRPIAISKPGFP